MIIRRNVKSLNAAEKKAFTDALLRLKHLPGRLNPASAQSRYDDYVEVHLDAMNAMMMGHMPNWGHQSSAFGPWHRVLLYHFESELRLIDPSVSLPYWDWTDPDSTAAVFSPDLLGGNGRDSDGQVMDGPFAFAAGNWTVTVKDEDADPDFLARQFSKDSTARDLPTAAAQETTMAMSIYDDAPWYDRLRTRAQTRLDLGRLFRLSLEVDLHNLVHRYIGGDMALATSPNDPVFFLHHCSLDRLWSLWEQTTGKAAPYAPPHGGPAGQSGDQPLIFHFPSSQPPWLGDAMPQDVYDSRAQIGIGYDSDLQHTPTEAEFAFGARVGAMKMKMSPSKMYPLRSELLDSSARRREMFPLRDEIQSGND